MSAAFCWSRGSFGLSRVKHGVFAGHGTKDRQETKPRAQAMHCDISRRAATEIGEKWRLQCMKKQPKRKTHLGGGILNVKGGTGG